MEENMSEDDVRENDNSSNLIILNMDNNDNAKRLKTDSPPFGSPPELPINKNDTSSSSNNEAESESTSNAEHESSTSSNTDSSFRRHRNCRARNLRTRLFFDDSSESGTNDK